MDLTLGYIVWALFDWMEIASGLKRVWLLDFDRSEEINLNILF